MHPFTQAVVAACCLALVAMGGYALTLMDEPRRVVSIEEPPSAVERSIEEHCRITRQIDPTGTATAMGRRNPQCYEE